MRWIRKNWAYCVLSIVILALAVLYGMADSGYTYNGYRFGP